MSSLLVSKPNNHYFSSFILLTKTFNHGKFIRQFKLASHCGGCSCLLGYWLALVLTSSFVKKWIAYLNIDVDAPDAKKGMGLMFGGSFVLMFVQALAIAIIAERMEIRGDGWMSGLKLGALTGACLCATTIGVNYLYEKKPLGLFMINAGYALVGNIIAGIIICTWY